MKKLRILCAAALICLLPGMALAAEAVPAVDTAPAADTTAFAQQLEQPLSAFGEVTEKGEDYLVLKLEANGMNLAQIQLNIGEESAILDNETAKAVDFADIKVGQRVFAYYDRAMTRSIPPQSHLELLLTNVDKTTPANLWQVESWDGDTEGNIHITTDNGGLYLTVPEKAWIEGKAPGSLAYGAKVLAWYDVVLTSYPSQAGAAKAMVFNPAEAAQQNTVMPSTALAEVISTDFNGDYPNMLVKVNGEEIQFNLDAATRTVSAATAKAAGWQGIKAGDKVLANFGPQKTFSLPPQSPLNYLVTDFGDTPPAGLFTVEQVEQGAQGGYRVLVDNGGLWLTLNKDNWGTETPKQGDSLLAWYDIVAESYPAQAVPTKTLAVPAAELWQKMPATLLAGDLRLSNVTERAHGHFYVPLRAVAEALGFTVDWSDADMSATLSNDKIKVTVYINKTNCAVDEGDNATLAAAPYLQSLGGVQKTYVPEELFELLGYTVEIADDNSELVIAAK